MRKCILRKIPGKFSGSLPQRYVGAGRQKLFQPEFTQNGGGKASDALFFSLIVKPAFGKSAGGRRQKKHEKLRCFHAGVNVI